MAFPSDGILQSQDFLPVSNLPCVREELIYASEQNFLGKRVYPSGSKAWLHRDAYEKLEKVCRLLQEEKPGFSLLIYDALRPRSVQVLMRQRAVEMQKSLYVARPEMGSIHNYGMALDLGILDAFENPLDMGTPVDYFGPLAQPQRELEMLEQGHLTKKQYENRLLLRNLMIRGGWIQLPSEWWHFNAAPAAWVREHYEIVE